MKLTHTYAECISHFIINCINSDGYVTDEVFQGPPLRCCVVDDEWEDANGLDKNNADDGAAVAENGYTNLENYMNGLVAHIMEGGNEGGVVLSGNDEFTTGISNVTVGADCLPDKIYNLQGMEVKEPLRKGIYIRNGKKYYKN